MQARKNVTIIACLNTGKEIHARYFNLYHYIWNFSAGP